MIENVSTQLTVFHCLCPLPASRKGLRLPLRSALFGEGGSNWRPCHHTPFFSRFSSNDIEIASEIAQKVESIFYVVRTLF